MPKFLFRLWVHEAQDGLVPEVVVVADTKIEAAAAAIRHFSLIGRPFNGSSYLECHGSNGFRVTDVLDAMEQGEVDTALLVPANALT